MLAIVFVHYDLPEERLRQHVDWNCERYVWARPFVVVSTKPIELHWTEFPWQDELIIYKPEMPIFSLSATKNFGINCAITCGYDKIAATDADIAWTPEAIKACQNVGPKEAIVPVYRMARTFETRHEVSHPDHGCGGTVCMTAENWKRAMYDERYVGYGGEDGRLRRDIAKLGIHERRETEVFHIAHDPDASQVNVPGAGRADCWNRDTINPDNWAANRKLIDK
jgi:hypothetical protein